MSSDPRNVGAHIDIYEESYAEPAVIVPRRIRINGVDVGLTTREAPLINTGVENSEPLKVTITLLPRSVSIHHEKKEAQ